MTAKTRTRLGFSILATAAGSPVVAWRTVVVVVGRCVVDVVDELVTLVGGAVVVVDELTCNPATELEVVLDCEDGPKEREHPLAPTARISPTSATARTRLSKGQGARLMRSHFMRAF